MKRDRKYILDAATNRETLFDLEADFDEQGSLLRSGTEEGVNARRELRQALISGTKDLDSRDLLERSVVATPPEGPPGQGQADLIEELKALGYL